MMRMMRSTYCTLPKAQIFIVVQLEFVDQRGEEEWGEEGGREGAREEGPDIETRFSGVHAYKRIRTKAKYLEKRLM